MTLVIGYGNRLRGDDAVGCVIAERLDQTTGSVTVVCCHQLVPELAARIARATTVVFVDGRYGDAPGRVRCAPVSRGSSPAMLWHSGRPEALLALAADIFEAKPQAYLVSVDIAATDFGADLSREVASAVPKACATIRRLARLSARYRK